MRFLGEGGGGGGGHKKTIHRWGVPRKGGLGSLQI